LSSSVQQLLEVKTSDFEGTYAGDVLGSAVGVDEVRRAGRVVALVGELALAARRVVGRDGCGRRRAGVAHEARHPGLARGGAAAGHDDLSVAGNCGWWSGRVR